MCCYTLAWGSDLEEAACFKQVIIQCTTVAIECVCTSTVHESFGPCKEDITAGCSCIIIRQVYSHNYGMYMTIIDRFYCTVTKHCWKLWLGIHFSCCDLEVPKQLLYV